MLEDVQERLVYRTHIYIQTDITGYKPAPGDLAYPDKLVMMEVRSLLLYLIFSLVPHGCGYFVKIEYYSLNYHSKYKIKMHLLAIKVIGNKTKESNTNC